MKDAMKFRDFATLLHPASEAHGIRYEAKRWIIELASGGILPANAETIRIIDSAGRSGTLIYDDKPWTKQETTNMPTAKQAEDKMMASQATDLQTDSAKANPARFGFGPKSNANLVGVKRELVLIADLAIRLTTQDFMIYDGLRTYEEQAHNVKTGVSKTMHSKHLPQSDGQSWAVDAVPVVGGVPTWDWNRIWPVALAMDEAATKLGLAGRIRWGGAWDMRMSDIDNKIESYREMSSGYHTRTGKTFVDGPHFEWVA